MSVERTVEDVAVTIAWPRHFFECTPTAGTTPILPDDGALDLAEAARRAALRAFGSVEPAPEADVPALH